MSELDEMDIGINTQNTEYKSIGKNEVKMKDKKKAVISAVLFVVFGGFTFFIVSGDPALVAPLEGSLFEAETPTLSVAIPTATERETIIKPDPAYIAAPEFEDFQAISKMYVHAMTPFKVESERWLQGLLTLRTQREKIQLYTDMAKASAAEASMYEWQQKIDQLKNGTTGVSVGGTANNVNGTLALNGQAEFSTEQYGLMNLRMQFYLKENKYSDAMVSFSIRGEQYLGLQKNEIFAGRFVVNALDDNTLCVLVEDTVANQQQKIC